MFSCICMCIKLTIHVSIDENTIYSYICMHIFVILYVGKSNLGGKKEQEIKEHYQEKLSKMESELKQLKGALKRHQHIVKSKVL